MLALVKPFLSNWKSWLPLIGMGIIWVSITYAMSANNRAQVNKLQTELSLMKADAESAHSALDVLQKDYAHTAKLLADALKKQRELQQTANTVKKELSNADADPCNGLSIRDDIFIDWMRRTTNID